MIKTQFGIIDNIDETRKYSYNPENITASPLTIPSTSMTGGTGWRF